MDHNSAAIVQSLLDQIRHGDSFAVQVLLSKTTERLSVLAKRIGGNIPSVKRFEQTDDLLQNSMIRLWKAFDNHHPLTPLDFFRLAASIMRRELIDMSRHHFGAMGLGANLAKSNEGTNERVSPIDLHWDETSEPEKLSQWTEFHEYVDGLEPDVKILFDLIWYQGLTLAEAAEIAQISERTLRRRWKIARVNLYRELMEP